ncbi:hypothetical protein [Streptomyces acidiscabies]|uniref:Metallo-beta-lactamase domain-containing protein n=1 Tax=Streptomyces acidiscabies TaxID=42234 RepID=A0AAP6BEA9_9ACTN|nr:hypothetical protein [Streptomyces acidiscabies]MBZ3913424.1 hypothetical protein [Streptomyces acidiscabies]MDX2963151.1 hypothetical protein [Streptomyces acidiscabies]MDX3024398.1 hypothetical protein [Streptomyces acidiscabies]MDX3796982.1 hypothetical protein [Streptomyces acidiscabies]GAQ53271.1 hypothetical protein a10_03074 [Streptomyces acidiscabies]
MAEPEWAQRHVLEAQALEPQVRTVAESEEAFPGARVRLTPGHTVYVIEAGGKRVVFGDAFHSPLQITRPPWENTIGFAVHFPDPFGMSASRAREDARLW